MKDFAIWEFIREQLEKGKPVALLAVLHSEGSSPGRQGFKMALAGSGEMCGSIGGGIMEHKLVELARKLLTENKPFTPIFKKQIHSKEAPQNQSGMICSGEQTVAIYYLQQQDLAAIACMLQVFSTNETEGQREVGRLNLNEKGLSFQPETDQTSRFTFSAENNTIWQFSERIPARETVYIIGGGHVALALSKVLALLNFELHLFDDRPGLNTFEANDYVHSKTVAPYSEISDYIPEGEQTYVVIMTFGYRPDKEALKQVLGKEFKYLGLMGSQSKIDQLFAELKEEGFSETDLKKVHAPIGIQIKSKTPEEIAISVAAQLVQVKNF
ncbi:XdhC family protein [Adhaeribacter soli]|uniref:XdhC family protein n=1 Tax=Adhaeribacter soli TaxID=2607655 RepID=A0A5N1J6C1_9BACT|nr:XdhC/CoxI family protein [Adhaeribacter soli]KAA9340737.1 XdhC family protein [Adhaeribacter soli]